MIVACYTDINNNRSFERYPTFLDLEQKFRSDHPNAVLNYVFDAKNQFIRDGSMQTNTAWITKEDELEKQEFMMLCNTYGFTQQDYKRQAKFPERSGVFEFYGFNRNNRKYKCLLRETTTGQNIKTTPEYLKKQFL